MRARSIGWIVALGLWPSAAFGQFTNPRREGSPRANERNGVQTTLSPTLPIGLRDCQGEDWVFQLSYAGDPTAGTATSLQFWIGTDAMACATTTARYPQTPTSCWPVQVAPSVNISNPVVPYTNNTFRIPARFLVDPLTGNCAAPTTPRGTVATNYLTLLAVTSAGLTLSGMSFAVPFDLVAPDPAASVGAVPGEQEVNVTWSYGVSSTETTTTVTNEDGTTTTDSGVTTTSVPADLQGFWVLCSPPPGGAVASDAGTDAALDASDDVPDKTFGDDASVASCMAAAFPTIDPNDDATFRRYVCSDLLSPSSTRSTVTGLRNGVPYRFAVVAQDNAGNRSLSPPSTCVVPAPVTDFWEAYRAAGGAARPLDCGASPGRRGAAPPCLAALALCLVSARRRRSRS